MADLNAVMAEHRANVGFREGPNNHNLWGGEQGVGDNHAYCDSATSMVAFHHGVNWWDGCTFKVRGCAYTVAHVNAARALGKYIEDHASQGKPAPLKVGQPVFFDWNGSGGVDHVETVAELPNGELGDQYVTIGYNTGNPEGCWRVVRDRKYLHGTIVMDEFYAGAPAPAPAPTPPPAHVESESDRIKQLQTLVRSPNDGVWGPNTAAACSHHMIGYKKPNCANESFVVSWLQRQGNRKYNAGLSVDGQVGPQTEHMIVNGLRQADGVCGPNGFREAVR